MSIPTLIAAFVFGATIGAVWGGCHAFDRGLRAGVLLGQLIEMARTAARAGNPDQGQGGQE